TPYPLKKVLGWDVRTRVGRRFSPWTPASLSVLAGLGLTDGQRPSAMRHAVEVRDGLLGFRLVRHLDKAKASRAPGVAIGNDLDALHRAIGFEQLRNVRFGGLPEQIADKKVHRSVFLWG